MENLQTEDFSQLCRLCLTQPTADQRLDVSTIYDEMEGLSYHECLKKCTGIDLHDNVGNVPSNLCKDCGLELQVAYDFYKKVKESKKLLQIFACHIQEPDASAVKPKKLLQLQQVTDEYDDEPENHIQLLDVTECLKTSNIETLTTEASSSSLEERSFDQEDEGETIEIVENELTEQVADLTNALDDELEYETIEELEDDEDEETKTTPERNNLKLNIETSMDELSNDELVSYAVIAVTPDSTKTPGLTSAERHPSGEYHCCYCNKVFKLHSRMISHQRIHEEDRPKYMCNVCNRVYASKQALKVHDRTNHTKTSPEECAVCGKRFAIAKLLEVHMRYHTGDFPFQCELCSRTFAQRSHLNTHRNVQHNQARFFCSYPECGKLFTSCNSLRNHEYTHSGMPFECAYCQRGFPAKAKLKVHIRNKHDQELTLEQLEEMRKFFVPRSKPHLVQIFDVGEEE